MKVLTKSLQYAGKWLNFYRAEFKNKDVAGVWEFVERPFKKSLNEPDGVGILAKVSKGGEEKVVTIATFRIPVNQWVIEFPAGMIEEHETDLKAAAIRELKEETGFVARAEHVKWVGMVSFNDPWKSNESNLLVRIDVDLDTTENKNPVQSLDPGESIKVELIPLEGILSYLTDLCKEKNYSLDSRVYTFALGVEMSKSKTL
jgi:8-oxo-dGTP pyrophosphatase MutT (NUDIX family)